MENQEANKHQFLNTMPLKKSENSDIYYYCETKGQRRSNSGFAVFFICRKEIKKSWRKRYEFTEESYKIDL